MKRKSSSTRETEKITIYELVIEIKAAHIYEEIIRARKELLPVHLLASRV